VSTRAVPWIGLIVLLAACDTQDLYIESDTQWAGTVGDRQVEGEGNAVIDLSGVPHARSCWRLEKRTTAGTLRAYLRDKTWFGLGTEIDSDQTTTAPNGVVEGCNS
jgi:hypothetical protein